MIAFLIALFLTLSTGGNICDYGESLDWYKWVQDHPTPHKIMEYEASAPNFWIYEADNGQILLFVFKRPLADTIAEHSSAAHGQCSRLITIDE